MIYITKNPRKIGVLCIFFIQLLFSFSTNLIIKYPTTPPATFIITSSTSEYPQANINCTISIQTDVTNVTNAIVQTVLTASRYSPISGLDGL